MAMVMVMRQAVACNQMKLTFDDVIEHATNVNLTMQMPYTLQLEMNMRAQTQSYIKHGIRWHENDMKHVMKIDNDICISQLKEYKCMREKYIKQCWRPILVCVGESENKFDKQLDQWALYVV